MGGASFAPLAPFDLRDLEFQLLTVAGAEALTALPRFAEHDAGSFRAALEAAAVLAREHFAPLQRVLDEAEVRFDDQGRVRLPAAAARALRAHARAGFVAATHDAADGGMRLPFMVAMACWSLFKASNIALEAYASLSAGVADLIRDHGTAAQRARWLAPLLDGRFHGTMALTEPQAGSALGELRTTATPDPSGNDRDGPWRIRGQKVFITGGDHELGDNIVHMVLARIAGTAGTRGLSLFVVPKRRLADGRPNDVVRAGLIHKLGFRGTTSAVLNFGEQDDCLGELLGAPGQGLTLMFEMMNRARIGIGFGAAMQAVAGYRASLAYARQRVQGRIEGRPVAIVAHADVRRMLLTQRAWAEGALALSLHAARLQDLHEHGVDADARRDALAQLELLTPVVKAWCSERGCAANDLAIQVLGGYGYARDHAVEQLWRDNRLNAIHEGTNGIQALDLVGRKLGQDGGRGFELLGYALEASLIAAGDGANDGRNNGTSGGAAALRSLASQLDAAWSALKATTALVRLTLRDDRPRALAQASAYLELFGTTVVGWLWIEQARAAARALARDPGLGADERNFLRGKLATAQHFYATELAALPSRHQQLRRLDDALRRLDDALLRLDEAWL